ncbi:MAG: APC family permease [Deltaproteobacteria bacterium]|nr:APC family permease [Deltaproteobacteria bacterium]MBI3391285.1 APC family permease [Deltaproteobacteria bacterium]
MTSLVLFIINVGLAIACAFVLRQKGLLGFAKGGKWYVTWLATGVITLMDELTSVFYAPAEAHRFIGAQAIFFIAFTSLLMRFLSSRMVEIGQILERNNVRGGGVYSFSYFVLGPIASFVAVASIMVDYILTACISTVSAVTNGTTFVMLGPMTAHAMVLGIIWGVAGLNIMGIRENARVTFGIFLGAAVVFVNLIALGLLNITPPSPGIMLGSATGVISDIGSNGLAHAIQVVTIGVASCVLAYSGIESVLQTAGLVESWRDIARAYWFLALTVGIVTPVVTALALSAPIDFAAHEGDLIPHWASVVGNAPFGVVVGVFGSIILIMAVNTAYVASSELLERVGHRYHFGWLIETNRRASLYRIHIINGALYSAVIVITSGSQELLADMYAIGLLASFCINIGCLLIYRYFRGTADIREYYTSRVGTFVLELILVACFIYLAFHKPYGTAMWAAVVTVLLAAGIPFSRRYGPERQEVRRSDYPMEMILELAETEGPLHLFFRRPGERDVTADGGGAAFITFFSPRQGMPEKLARNHYRFPNQGGVYRSIAAMLALLQEEFNGQDVHIHLGWPMSSWLDRMATGVFVANMTRLPKLFPKLQFAIEYQPPPASARTTG